MPEPRKKRKKSPSYSRNKGKKAEQRYKNRFRDIHFEKCITTRQGSRILDDSKIDLMFIPANIQVKAGYRNSMNYGRVLLEQQEAMEKNLPEGHENFDFISAVFHKKDIPNGTKRLPQDELVVMTVDDFMRLFRLAYKHD